MQINLMNIKNFIKFSWSKMFLLTILALSRLNRIWQYYSLILFTCKIGLIYDI